MEIIKDSPKKKFLESLRTKRGYKRYLGSPLRYAGGKSAAVGLVVELLPDDVEVVVSPFIGGGSVEVALAKELGIKVIAYDIFDVLVNFWQVLLKRKSELLDKLSKMNPDKETYNKVKERLTRHWKFSQYSVGKEEDLITDPVELAALYYFNHQLSYGPGFLGWPSSVYLNREAYSRFLEKLYYFEAPNLEVYQADFVDSIPRHKQEFLYLDPPYYLGPDSSVFRGLYPMRNIPVHHEGFPHEKLRDLLREHEGGFILHYNDCETIREFYKGYELHTASWHYSMGLGETRIGKYRSAKGKSKKESKEVIFVKR